MMISFSVLQHHLDCPEWWNFKSLGVNFMSRGDGVIVKLLLKVLAHDTILLLTQCVRHEFGSNAALVQVF